MNMATVYDVLVQVVPALLFSVLVIVLARMGLARWRLATIVLAIADIPVLVCASLLFRLTPGPGSLLLFGALAAAKCGGIIAIVGAFNVMIVAAQARRWGWFTGFAVAAVISALAAVLLVEPRMLFDFLAVQQAATLGSAPAFRFIYSVLTTLPLLLALLFALVNPRATTARTSAATIEDDVTLP